MPRKDPDRYSVEAVVREWKSSRYGVWGHAEILSDVPVKQATFGVKTVGAQPAEGEAFRCEITLGQKGWKVSRLLLDHLAPELERVAGTVDSSDTSLQTATYGIAPTDSGMTSNVTLSLPQKITNAAHIAWLASGTQVVLDAQREARGYVGTLLHTPHGGFAFPDYDPGTDGVTYQAATLFAVYDWDSSRDSKNVRFATCAPDAGVAALVWVPTKTLKAVGIRSVHAAVSAVDDNPERTAALIAEWSQVLRSGTREQIAALEIHCVSALLEPAKEGRAWNVHRVLSPASCRTPNGDGEIVDWVKGVIEAINDVRKTASRTPADGAEPPPDQPEIPGKKNRSDKSGDDNKIVSVAFDTPSVGRGIANAFVPTTTVVSAGMTVGTPVIIRLRSKSWYWNASHIHRATPSLRTGNDPEPAQ